MKRLSLIALLLASSALMAINEIKNVKDLKDALAMGKPTVVYVFADWCKYCDPALVDEAANANRNVHFVKVNNDTIKNDNELKAEVKKYDITGLPTYLFINGANHVKKSGGIAKEQFMQHIKDFAAGKLKSDEEIHAEWDRLVRESQQEAKPVEAAVKPAEKVEAKSAAAPAPAVKPAVKPAPVKCAKTRKTAQPTKLATRMVSPSTKKKTKKKTEEDEYSSSYYRRS